MFLVFGSYQNRVYNVVLNHDIICIYILHIKILPRNKISIILHYQIDSGHSVPPRVRRYQIFALCRHLRHRPLGFYFSEFFDNIFNLVHFLVEKIVFKP